MKQIFIIIVCLLSYCFNAINAQTYTQVYNVETPNGSTVPDCWTLTSADVSYTSAQFAAEAVSLHNQYNGAELIEYRSYKYNCHAYAWHVSEGGAKVWMGRFDVTAENVYWTDGSYTEVAENVATKVSYHQDGNHSAIRLNSTWYQSKWGWAGPLVKHHPNDVPVDYQPSKVKKYYRRTISGPDQICDEGTYTLNNLPTGATINWGSTGSGGLGRVLSLVSGQGTPTAVFRKIFPGNHTIYADITIGGITARAEKNNIATGTPSMPSSWIDNITASYSTPGYVTYPVCFSSLAPNTSYYIQFDDQGYSSMPYLGYDVENVSGTNVQVVKGVNCLKITPTGLGTKVIRVRAHNACGESDPLQITINVQNCLPGPGGPGTDPITLSCYPNPADDVLNVSIEEETQQLSSSRSLADKPVYTIRLWSGVRGLVRTVEAQQGTVTQISLQGLPSGLCFVHIIKDGEILRKQIIQKR